jgi:hypothetical protein
MNSRACFLKAHPLKIYHQGIVAPSMGWSFPDSPGVPILQAHSPLDFDVRPYKGNPKKATSVLRCPSENGIFYFMFYILLFDCIPQLNLHFFTEVIII